MMELYQYFVLNLPECTFSTKYTDSAYNYLKIMPFLDSAGIKPRASRMLGKYSTIQSQH